MRIYHHSTTSLLPLHLRLTLHYVYYLILPFCYSNYRQLNILQSSQHRRRALTLLTSYPGWARSQATNLAVVVTEIYTYKTLYSVLHPCILRISCGSIKINYTPPLAGHYTPLIQLPHHESILLTKLPKSDITNPINIPTRITLNHPSPFPTTYDAYVF